MLLNNQNHPFYFPGPLLNTGFHFNVGNWPGHVDTAGSRNGTCDWLLSSESLRASGDSEGIFLSVAHWYPPHTSCTYLMQGEEGEIVRLYFPRLVGNPCGARRCRYRYLKASATSTSARFHFKLNFVLAIFFCLLSYFSRFMHAYLTFHSIYVRKATITF